MFPELKTERLLLRKILPEDQENIFRGLSDPVVTEYYGVKYDSMLAVSEQMDWYKELEKTKKGLWWAITNKKKGNFIGACGFNSWEKPHQRIEIGFWLLPKFWGKGYVSEAVNKIISYSFKKMNVHRIEGWIEGANFKSKKVMKGLGFQPEAHLKDYEIKDGIFIDMEIYALINSQE